MSRLVKWMLFLALAACAFPTLLLAIGLSLPLDEIPQFGSRPLKLVIADATVIDVERGTELRNRTVQIERGKISGVTHRHAGGTPRAAMVIDGRGKYLVPGLWDAHVHTVALSDRLHFPLMIANGVTSIRNMGDGCSWSSDLVCVPDHRQWKSGNVAPRIVGTASHHIEELASPASALNLVKAIQARGDDIIKIQLHDEDDPDSSKFNAIVKASREAGIAVTGHVPLSANLHDPIYGALSSIEHDTQLIPHCSSRRLRQCDSLLRLLAMRSTAYVPTHVASTGQDVALAGNNLQQDDLLQYTSSPVGMVWKAYRFLHRTGTNESQLKRLKDTHAEALRLTLRAHRAGVQILAGSDSLDPFVLHGAGLHEELEYLGRSGLSPAEVLRTATTTPARILGTGGETGRIEIGQRADLILLASNPLDDIKATRTIELVTSNGAVYGPEDLERMRSFVKEQSASLAVGARAWLALLGFGTK